MPVDAYNSVLQKINQRKPVKLSRWHISALILIPLLIAVLTWSLLPRNSTQQPPLEALDALFE